MVKTKTEIFWPISKDLINDFVNFNKNYFGGCTLYIISMLDLIIKRFIYTRIKMYFVSSSIKVLIKSKKKKQN